MRKVTFIDSKSQSQKVINNSTATTLGELKAEMRTAGIDYTDMSFYEGHIRAELLDDNSILPTDIPYKGQVVNDLVFMLSTTNKKIKSGANRTEVYQMIKKLNLQDEVKRIFNRNYTQVSTDDLRALVSRHISVDKSKKVETISMETPITCDERFNRLKEAFMELAGLLYDYGMIDVEDYDMFAETFDYDSASEQKKTSMTSEEINEMFNFMN